MKNKVILNISGKNINNFISRLHRKQIEVLSINYIDYKTIQIEIYSSDLDTVLKLKTIYEVNIISYKGHKYIVDKIKYNKYLLVAILFGVIIFTILTNIIFDINIIYNGRKMNELLTNELKNYGIKKYSLAKSFNELEIIKNNIIKDNKDKIEWLEIKRVGIKYEVRVEPRKINNIDDSNKMYNIVSSKDAIIKRIESKSGEKIKNINDYVKKGDVVISSDITLNGEVRGKSTALGNVYGEVWYSITTEYPLDYYEEKYTGKKKDTIMLKLLNKYYGLNSFKDKKVSDKVLLKSDLLPLSLVFQKQEEIYIINDKLNEEEALKKAMDESRNKMRDKLNDEEYIMSEKCLKIDMKESTIKIYMFYTIYENITEYVEIEG